MFQSTLFGTYGLKKKLKSDTLAGIVCICIIQVYLYASVLQQREEITLRGAASDKKVGGKTGSAVLLRKTETVGEIY